MMKKINIFTMMMIVASFALVLRLVDLSNFSTPHSVAESTEAPKHFEKAGPDTTAPSPVPPASAETATTPTTPTDTPTTPAAKLATEPPAVSPYGEHAYSESELDVLQSLSKRREELDKREQQVVQHEAVLKAAEGEVDRKIAELNKIKGELLELLNKQQTMQNEQINSLVKIYEGMKPKEAARIFDTLDMDVLLAVISKMSERKSSPILAVMDPEKARSVTIKLSERIKLPDVVKDIQEEKPAAPAEPTPAPAAAPTDIPAPSTPLNLPTPAKN